VLTAYAAREKHSPEMRSLQRNGQIRNIAGHRDHPDGRMIICGRRAKHRNRPIHDLDATKQRGGQYVGHECPSRAQLISLLLREDFIYCIVAIGLALIILRARTIEAGVYTTLVGK
jgi:hypothetical protein